MKKFAYVFILLFGFIVTFGIFNEFNQSYFNDLENLIRNYQDLSDKEGLIINLYLLEQGITENQVTDKLLDVSQNHDIDIIMNLDHKDKYKRNVINTYIHSKEFKFENYFYLEEDKTIDFNDITTDNYISSDSLDKNKYNTIKFLSDKYTTGNAYPVLNFMPLHTVEKYDSGNSNFVAISFFYDDTYTTEEIKNIVTKTFPFIDDTQIFNIDSHEDMEFQEEKMTLTNFLAPILLLIILLIGTSYINSNLKEISIRKMHGNKSSIIFMRLMKKFIISSIFIYLLSIIFSYFILGGDFTSISLNVFKPITLSAGIFLIIVSLFTILSYLYLKYIASFVALKKSKVNMKMVYGNLFIKTVLFLLILTPLVSEISQGYNGFQKIYYYNKYYKKEPYNFNINRNSSIEGSLADVEGEMIDLNRILFEKLIKNNRGMYADFSLSYHHPEMIKAYESRGHDIPHPSITVDYNYLKDYEIRNEEGKKIDISKVTENTVFVPFTLKNKDYQTYNAVTDSISNIVYVVSEKSFLDPNITSEKIHIEEPIINYIVDYINMIEPIFDTAFYSSDEEIRNILLKNNVERYYEIEDYSITYNYYMQSYWRDFLVSVAFLIIFSIIPIIFLYQSLSFHFNEKKKEVALKYSMGISYFSRYKEVIFLHLVPYIALLISVWTIMNINQIIATYLLFYFIIIDLIFMAWIFNRFEKKSIAMILKGE